MKLKKHGSMYTKAGRDYREFLFFLFIIFSVYIKFYCLEFAVSPVATRYASSAFSSLGIILMFFSPVLLLWRRVRAFFAILLDFALTALMMTDLLHMRYYTDLFTFANIGLSTQVSEIAESVLSLVKFSDLLYFADFPILILYLAAARKLSVKSFFKKISFRRVCLALLVFAAGASLLTFRIVSYQKKVPGVLSSMWDRPAVCNNVGALTYHAADAWNVISQAYAKKHVPLSEIEEVSEWLSQRDKNVKRSLALKGIAKGKNLIIIQVESLQHFVVGLKYNGQEITPNLNRFVRDSVFFSCAYNQTALGNSSDAEFLVNTGLYPARSGVAYTRFAANKYLALPKILSENGYSTLALHGDRPGFWNRQHMYLSMGFDRFISKKDFVIDENIGMGLSDKSFFRQSLKILSKEQKPFYSFLITLTSHYPFNFSAMLAQTPLEVGEFQDTLMGNYLISMRYFDNQFGMFINGLKDRGLLDSSVIVVYGDHTAIPIWDRPNLEKLMGRSLQSDVSWREMQKVPLILHVPGIKKNFTDDTTPVGLADVPTTLANILGVEFPYVFGSDMFASDMTEPVIFRNGSYILKDVFVEPSVSKATGIKDGLPKNYVSYSETTSEVRKRLGISDKILEHDLINKITE